MQRSMISKSLASSTQILRPLIRGIPPSNPKPPCDIFINHRGVDTKRTIAGLLYQHLSGLGYHPFLDSKSMKPGDNLFDKIDPTIKNCRVGVAVFSPRYCESYFCLHELALMMEYKKKVVPIFCDVKPSELRVKDNGTCSPKQLERFHRSVEEAKNIVGLTFDTSNGDWSEFLTNATETILGNLVEAEEDEKYFKHNITNYYEANLAENSN
ncbi:vesicle-associated protein 1-4-like [Chenopodium quinoa]|uniref:TIR domain-containing protein n=1 Tax=Chenopodium quinoa TaxID=63459 RepID=A0A803LLC2_CHEQI|nr:vesicle-associated protein 1-4-like [Chenopodium quinoa]